MTLLNTEIIENINKQITGVNNYANNFNQVINTTIPTKINAQAYIDEQAAILSSYLTGVASAIRTYVVELFAAQYKEGLEYIKPLQPLANVSVTSSNMISILQTVVNLLGGPYNKILAYNAEIIPYVLQVSDELVKIANFKLDLEVPEGVTVPDLTINVEPITAADITGG